jgi:hypothetical protein
MFISVLDLFKIGLGPSSSHTMGPLTAASRFRQEVEEYLRTEVVSEALRIKVQLFGSLAWTGKGHQSDTAVLLGLHGYDNRMAAGESITVGWEEQIEDLSKKDRLDFSTGSSFGSSFDAPLLLPLMLPPGCQLREPPSHFSCRKISVLRQGSQRESIPTACFLLCGRMGVAPLGSAGPTIPSGGASSSPRANSRT